MSSGCAALEPRALRFQTGVAMRIAVVMAAVAIAGCASDRLAPTPPPGVDLSAHWKINEAESDDPQRLLQSQLANATAAAGPGGSTGSGRRGGGQRGGGYAGGPLGPAMPSVTVLDEALRWPGKDLVINQSAGTVTFSSGAGKRVCRPDVDRHRHRHSGNDDASHGRGDVPPPVCGWDAATLVVQSGEPDDERPPFELRFSVSDGGQRLIEVASFKGGRSSGFTASRVWDRVPAPAAGAAAPGAAAPASTTKVPQ
jgi:hypothetical protein